MAAKTVDEYGAQATSLTISFRSNVKTGSLYNHLTKLKGGSNQSGPKKKKNARSHRLVIVIPDFHGPIGRAGDEYPLEEAVPSDGIDGHGVSTKGRQDLIVVVFGELEDQALFGAHHKQLLLLVIEIETRSRTLLLQIIRNI
jgi:hypothetical protein